MRARAVQLGDDIGNGVADARNLLEPSRFYYLFKSNHQCGEAIRGPGIGLGPVGIPSAQRGAAGKFPEQLCDGFSVLGSHENPSGLPDNAQISCLSQLAPAMNNCAKK